MSEDANTYVQEVLLFSVLRDRVGASRIHTTVHAGISGADLLDQLAEAYPALAPYRSTIRLAINQEYVDEATTLSRNDEVALITPVSGG